MKNGKAWCRTEGEVSQGQSRHLTRVSFLFFSRVHTLHRRKTDLEEFDPIISRQ